MTEVLARVFCVPNRRDYLDAQHGIRISISERATTQRIAAAILEAIERLEARKDLPHWLRVCFSSSIMVNEGDFRKPSTSRL